MPFVPLGFQSCDPLLQCRGVRYRAREATALNDADLDFGLIEPAPMLGGVVERYAGQDMTGLLGGNVS